MHLTHLTKNVNCASSKSYGFLKMVKGIPFVFIIWKLLHEKAEIQLISVSQCIYYIKEGAVIGNCIGFFFTKLLNSYLFNAPCETKLNSLKIRCTHFTSINCIISEKNIVYDCLIVTLGSF